MRAIAWVLVGSLVGCAGGADEVPRDSEVSEGVTDAYELTHLVLADPGAEVEEVFGGYYQPNVLVLDRLGLAVWRTTGGAAAGSVEEAVVGAL